jgi:hypothetical protein
MPEAGSVQIFVAGLRARPLSIVCVTCAAAGTCATLGHPAARCTASPSRRRHALSRCCWVQASYTCISAYVSTVCMRVHASMCRMHTLGRIICVCVVYSPFICTACIGLPKMLFTCTLIITIDKHKHAHAGLYWGLQNMLLRIVEHVN